MKLEMNPNNRKYYSEDFIKGFECGVERQFNVDVAEKTAEWISKDITDFVYCSKCDYREWYTYAIDYNYCPNCGARMKKETDGESK